MKTKHIITVMLACLGLACSSPAQETAPATSNDTPAVESASETAAPAPAEKPAEETPALEAAAAQAAPAPAPAANPDGVIPLIQFVDAPITAVIENLARQAGLNYILDPKMNYGQPGADGKVVAQPSISIRWENLTAQQALGALLSTYDLQLIEDPKTKIVRVAPKDPAAPDPLVTKVIQLKFANPSNILASVQSALTDKRSKVVTDIRTSQLVVVATEKEIVIVDDIVTRLDTQTKQVLIEARLIETSMNPTSAKGVDWSGTLANQRFNFGNSLIGTNSLGFSGVLQKGGRGYFVNPTTFFLNADGLDATLSFLNTDSDTKVIATPRAVTLDNETADLAVTVARPIFKTTAGTQGSPGGSEVLYTNLGTILRVTPRVSANDYVNLRVIPEVSTFVNTVTKTVGGLENQADVFAFRKIDTQVLIPSGNTLVLGGLISDSSSKAYTKVPILGDIPLAGMAFRKESKERDQKNLLIFVTPTIVRDADFQPTQTDFLKSTPAEYNPKPWNAWNSGKPAIDWTKPSGGVKEQ